MKRKLKDKDVRILYLPPATVAAIHKIGREPVPEKVTGDILFDFIKKSNLSVIMPGFRQYGFNNPDEPVHGDGHGYERWVTVPDDFEVPKPFKKKSFCGGMYAATAISMGEWDIWMQLHKWVEKSKQYDIRWGTLADGECRICGWLEEHLNAPTHYLWTPEEIGKRLQLDLLIPIKECIE